MSFRAFKVYVKRRVGHQENEGYHSSISLKFLANIRIPNHVFQLCVAYASPWTSSSGSSTTRNLRASPNWYLKPRRPSAVQGLKSCQWSCFFLRVHFFAIYFSSMNAAGCPAHRKLSTRLLLLAGLCFHKHPVSPEDTLKDTTPECNQRSINFHEKLVSDIRRMGCERRKKEKSRHNKNKLQLNLNFIESGQCRCPGAVTNTATQK